jgi:hypothetical protein
MFWYWLLQVVVMVALCAALAPAPVTGTAGMVQL